MAKKTKETKIDVAIEFPPVCPSFDLPTRGQLLDVKIGDSVKLIFGIYSDTDEDIPAGERMWLTVIEKHKPDRWRGLLESQPLLIGDMNPGEEFEFHPLQIIDITKKEKC